MFLKLGFKVTERIFQDYVKSTWSVAMNCIHSISFRGSYWLTYLEYRAYILDIIDGGYDEGMKRWDWGKLKLGYVRVVRRASGGAQVISMRLWIDVPKLQVAAEMFALFDQSTSGRAIDFWLGPHVNFEPSDDEN